MGHRKPPTTLMLGRKNTHFIEDYMITPIVFEDGLWEIAVQPKGDRRFLLVMSREELKNFIKDCQDFLAEKMLEG